MGFCKALATFTRGLSSINCSDGGLGGFIVIFIGLVEEGAVLELLLLFFLSILEGEVLVWLL